MITYFYYVQVAISLTIWVQKMNFNLAVWLFFARCTLSAESTSKHVFDRITKYIKKIHRIQLIEKGFYKSCFLASYSLLISQRSYQISNHSKQS